MVGDGAGAGGWCLSHFSTEWSANIDASSGDQLFLAEK